MTQVYLSIGSNINRSKHLRYALSSLESTFGTLNCSDIYQNPAVGFEGKDFYNLVVGLEVGDTLEALHRTLKTIETKTGRVPHEHKFSARTLDIDILLFGDDDFHPKFDIPRQEITRYNFVLQPLAEIAPTLKHPTLGKTMHALWQSLMPNQHLSDKVTLKP